MNCYLHADRQAELHCASCGNLICEACDVRLADHHVCKKCLAEAEAVPPQLAVTATRETRSARGLNFGLITFALVIGGLMGAVGGQVYHRRMDMEGLLLAIFWALCSGFGLYLTGALMAVMIVPSSAIKAKGGVLGLFGITDYGAAMFWTLLVAALVWFCN